MAQWKRIFLPVQGTQVRSLIWGPEQGAALSPGRQFPQMPVSAARGSSFPWTAVSTDACVWSKGHLGGGGDFSPLLSVLLRCD